MRNIKIILQYIGTHYCGWQIQPNGPTVQETLQKTLGKILQEELVIIGAGRTDSGVHAIGQGVHVKLNNPIELSILHRALNGTLPEDIAVLSLEEMPENFHAMKDAKTKTYSYLILNTEQKYPFLTPFTWRKYGDLDLDEMNICLEMLLGEQDFSSFCAADSTAKTRVRNLEAVGIQRLTLQDLGNSLLSLMGLGGMVSISGPADTFHPDGEDKALVILSFKGRGFLKHMVRNIVGTLMDVGMGKINSREFKRIFESKDRRQAGVTAPAHGLFLVKVDY